MLDKAAEKAAEWFGSAAFILLHVVWFAAWFPLGGDTDLLTLIVSLEAIFLSLFILRAENVASRRMERSVKKDLAKSNEVLRKLKDEG